MSKMKHSWRVVVGDWSRDGHNESEFIRFSSTHTRKDIIKGYKKAHKIAGGGVCGPGHDDMFDNYGDKNLHSDDLENLAKVGLTRDELLESEWFEEDDEDICVQCAEGVAYLFLEMTRFGLAELGEEFDYEFVPDKVEDCINGFWQSDFNHGMGYGVLGDY